MWEKDGIKLDTGKKKHDQCDTKRRIEGLKDRKWEQVKRVKKDQKRLKTKEQVILTIRDWKRKNLTRWYWNKVIYRDAEEDEEIHKQKNLMKKKKKNKPSAPKPRFCVKATSVHFPKLFCSNRGNKINRCCSWKNKKELFLGFPLDWVGVTFLGLLMLPPIVMAFYKLLLTCARWRWGSVK